MWKRVEEMTGSEVVNEAHNLASYAQSCREIGQGINTKESVRFRACMNRVETEKLCPPAEMVDLHVQWDGRLAKSRDLLLRLFEGGCTMAGMRALVGG